MMDVTTTTQISESLIQRLLNDLGNPGSWIVIISIFLLPYATTIINWIVTLRDRPSKRDKEYIDKIANALEENQETMASDLENAYEILAGIDHKIKNFISGEDCLIITKKFFNGSMFEALAARSMYFSKQHKEAKLNSLTLKRQFSKEMKNTWSELINNLNKINTPIKIGDFIDNKFYSRFFAKNGVMDKIIDITFETNTNAEPAFRYENIKATFDYFSNEIVDALTVELDKIGKLKNGE